MLSYTYYGNLNSIENPISKTNISAYFVGNNLLIKNPENQKGEYQLFCFPQISQIYAELLDYWAFCGCQGR